MIAQQLQHHSRNAYPARFTTAYALLGLLSQCRFVDPIIGGLEPNTIALLRGSKLPLLAAERYCIRAQLPEHLGGLSGSALFIDGGNSFDIYLFTSIAREYGIDFDDALRKIIVSRAFTPYELLHLITKEASQVFDAYQPKLLVVADVFNLFAQDIGAEEAKRILGKIRNAIFRTNRLRHVPVVITETSRAEHLQPLIQEACNIEVEFVEEKHQIKSKLLKHPSNRPAEIVQDVGDQLYNQNPLVSFVMPHG